MLGADLVPRSHNSTLKERESRFDSVGMNISDYIDAGTVVNRFVILDASLLHGERVRRKIIGDYHFHVSAHVLADVLCERARLGICGMEEAQITVALANSDYYFFVLDAIDATFAFVHSAHIGFIYLDRAVEHGLIGLRHCAPDAVAEVPRRLIAHSDRALNLASGHTFLRFAEQVRSQKPFGQGQVRIVEHSAGRNGKLIIAILAVEELFFGFKFDHGQLATQAARPFGEAQAHQKLAALVLGREKRIDVN